MTDRIQEQVTHLLKDDSRPARDRVGDLLKLREDARALQRAGNGPAEMDALVPEVGAQSGGLFLSGGG